MNDEGSDADQAGDIASLLERGATDSSTLLLNDGVEEQTQSGADKADGDQQSSEQKPAPQLMRSPAPADAPAPLADVVKTLSCEAVYAVSATGQIQEVPLTGGAKSNVGDPASGVSIFNGLGISPGGTKAYGYERSSGDGVDQTVKIYSYDPTSEKWAYTGASYDSKAEKRSSGFIGGAVAPDGTYYLGGFNSSRFNIFRYNEGTPGNVEFVGFIYVGGETGNNGDIAFDAQGTLYVVRGSGSTVTIYPVSAATLASAEGNNTTALTRGESKSFSAMNDVNGAAFGSNGRAFLGSSNTIRGYDMPNWSNKNDLTSTVSCTDLASCSNPPTILLQKNVIGRRGVEDQFGLELRQGKAVIGTASTSGTQTGIQRETVGPFPVSAGVELQFSEWLLPSGTITNEYTAAYECLVNPGTPSEKILSSGDGVSGSVTIPATGSDPVVCTFTNTPKTGTWELTKSSDPESGSVVKPGQEITYTVTAKNTSNVDVRDVVIEDDLSAVLANADLVGSITAEQGTASVTGDILTWKLDTLGANSTKTLTYKVKVHDDAIGVTLRNVVTVPDKVTPPEECPVTDPECRETTHETGAPTIAKTGISAEKKPGTGLVYDLVYQVTVNNPTSQKLDYELTDAPPTLPKGVTQIGDWTVEAGTPAGTIVQDSKGDNDPWQLAKGSLEPGVTHTYFVKAVVEVDRTVAVGDEACEDTETTGLVLINGATITSGDYEASDEGCVAIEMTQLNMSKSVASTKAEDDGTWTIVYDVVVSMPNTGSEEEPHHGRTTYDLKDELRFGAGITVKSAKWELNGHNPGQITPQNPQSGSWSEAALSTTLADDRPIGGSKNADPGNTYENTYEHTYTVTVTASVEEDAWGTEALKCQAEGPPTAGGFLNVAQLDYSGGQIIDDACSTPAIPAIEKTGHSAMLGEDGSTWTLKYEITVSNTSDSDLPFDLTDTPAPMPTGVERLGPWTAAVPGDSDVPLHKPTFDGVGTWQLVQDGQIPAGTDFHYEISTTVKITTAVGENEVGECEDSEDIGIVFPNVAEVTSGKHKDDDEGCVVIPTADLDLTKTWKSSSQRKDGSWDVVYDVVVLNDSDLDQTYDLTDEIKFNQAQIKVLGGTWSGPEPATGTIGAGATAIELAKGTAIAAGVTHTYVVTVHASVMPSAWTAPTQPTKCEAQGGPANGGFFNTAQLEWVGGSAEAEDCASPKRPGIDKEFLFAQPHADDPNLWTVAYTVFVLGSPDTSFYVDVFDQPGFPTGVKLVEGSWFSPYPNEGGIEITECTIDVAGDDAWLIEREVFVPKGGMVRYQVSWDVRINGKLAQDLTECSADGAGHGFFNEARLVNGGTTQKDEACAPISPAVNPSVEKNVRSTVQKNDGTWAIEYEIVVLLPTRGANPSGLSAKYDLTDTLDYGDGLKPLSATWKQTDPAGMASASKDFKPSTWSANLASGKIITVQAPEHVYRVSVVAEAGTAAFENGTDVCVVGEGGSEASGFLNRVEIKSNETTTEAEACTEPAAPVVSKVAEPVVDNGDGTWTVSYLATVTNPTGGESGVAPQDLVYQLIDTPAALPDGVELVGSWKAAAADEGTATAGLPTNPDRPAKGKWVVAEGEIPADTTYSFTISAEVGVVVADLGEFADCEAGGKGIGLTNALGVVSGGFEADDEDCVSIPVPDLEVIKDVVSVKQTGIDGTWRIVYDVVVTNSSKQGTVYDLTDDLKFGGGITVTGASWTGPTSGDFPEGKTSATLASNKYIPGETYHVYTVTAIAKVAAQAWEKPGDLQCGVGDGGGGGFLNEASLSWPGGEVEDEDCASPVRPTIQKEGVHATQSDVDPTQWTVSYVLTVDGKNLKADTVYDLSDAPKFASGVTVNSGVAKLRGGEGSVSLPAAGGKIVEGKALAAGATDTWDVSWSVTINAPIPPADAECAEGGAPGKGFFNTAALSTGGTTQEDEACLPINTLVRPSVDKAVKSVQQNDDGSWGIKYEVVVDLPAKGEGNPNGLSAKYDLVDTLDYGDGLTPVSATWQQVTPEPAGSVGNFDSATWSAQLAKSKAITAGATHVYEVVVVAEAGNAAFEEGTAYCGVAGSEGSSGFLNTASMTSGGTGTDVEACTEPAAPGASKVGQKPVQNSDGTFTVSYEVTVRNENDLSVVYQLTDTPDEFPAGVSLVEGTTWKAQAIAPTSETNVVAATKPTTGDWMFAAGRLEPGASDTFLITAQIAVDASKVQGLPLPEECGVSEVGIPLSNQLGMVSGEVEVDDPGCVAVPSPAEWELEKSSVAKSGSTVKPGELITYTLKVTNAGEINLFDAIVEDDLSDVLKHATLVKESLSEELVLSKNGQTLTWAVPEVAPGKSVTVSYKVKVNANASNVKFKNVATPASPDGECAPGKCTTNHNVPRGEGKLPITGANVAVAFGVGLLLLGGGYLALRSSRGRSSGRHTA